jgi:V-type H+-transporting ATPase subunit a
MLFVDYGLAMGSPVFVVVGMVTWSCATASVLLGMDTLECFLHALRLQWVEHQSKYFEGTGYAFAPFSFPAEVDLSNKKRV